QRAGFKGEEQYIQSALKLAKDNQLPVVATHPVQFLKTEDFDVHEVRVCIAEGEILGDKSRNQRFTREQYLKNTQEMCDLFSDIPSALQNSIEIAKRCNVVIELGTAK